MRQTCSLLRRGASNGSLRLFVGAAALVSSSSCAPSAASEPPGAQTGGVPGAGLPAPGGESSGPTYSPTAGNGSGGVSSTGPGAPGAGGASPSQAGGAPSVPGVGTTGGSATAPSDGGAPVPPPPAGAVAIPPSPQPDGDPDKGYAYLVNGPYLSHGVPWTGFKGTMTPLQPTDSVPGRLGDNANVGYDFNVSTNRHGMKIAAPNCLACHSTHLNGKLIIGLGRPNHTLVVPSGTSLNIPGMLLVNSPPENTELMTFGTRLIGAATSGELLVFASLASHHDPGTLTWQDTARFDAATGLNGWVDIPPWWRTKKKNGLYAQGMGRGVQSRHMSFMSIFSVEDTTEAAEIEKNFVDVGAFLRSIVPPAYPGPIDADRAAKGEGVFRAVCAECHGTYGANGSYPNLLIPHDVVGTDSDLAVKGWINQAAKDWFGQSYYAGNGEAWLEPTAAYVAPPLDGIWATAPFLHNGSVPTLDAVIDSSKRPSTWTSAFGDNDYDLQHVGWKNTPLVGDLYDTSQAGGSNKGHTYGDALPDDARAALLEYLKTL